MYKVAQFAKVSFEIFRSANEDKDISLINDLYTDIRLPERATVGSAGYDFFSPFDIDLAPGEALIVPTGIRAEIKNGWMLAVFPRSGLGFKYHLGLANTVGIIDSDFYFSASEGHIMLKLVNNGDRPLSLAKGKAFAQGIFIPFGITHDDAATGIRDGGFGSTDKK